MALKAACYHSMPWFSYQTSPSASLSLNQLWWFHPHLLLPATAFKVEGKVLQKAKRVILSCFQSQSCGQNKRLWLWVRSQWKGASSFSPHFVLTCSSWESASEDRAHIFSSLISPTSSLKPHVANGWSDFTGRGNHSYLDFERGGGSGK